MWILSKSVAKNKRWLLDNGIGVTMTCANTVQAKSQGHEIEHLRGLDMNNVMEGWEDINHFFECVLTLAKASLHTGVFLFCLSSF